MKSSIHQVRRDQGTKEHLNFESEYVDFGEVCRTRLGIHTETGSRYVNQVFSTKAAKESGYYYPFFGDGLRISGNPSSHQFLKIHSDDVEEFVRRVEGYLYPEEPTEISTLHTFY